MQNAETAPLGADHFPATTPGAPPPGLAEQAQTFRHAAALPSIQRRPAGSARPEKLGVRLSRAATPALAIPDVAALPRLLRNRQIKRLLDVVLAATLLIILALPMLVIAACLTPGGGALFVQPRVGGGRIRFGCMKFRTMRPDAETHLARVLASDPAAAAAWDCHQKLDDDPRTTRFGRFLRQSSLDELPQLLNVLRGEMSLVGPRPVIAPEVDGYPADRGYYASEAFEDYAGCLPGLTGLWQVSGRHGTSHSERVQMDRVYARNWSVLLDLKILVRTVGVVLARTGR